MLKCYTRFGIVSNPPRLTLLPGAVVGGYILHVCSYVCMYISNMLSCSLLLLLATKALCHGEPPLWAHVAYTMPIGRHVGRSKLEEMVSRSQSTCNQSKPLCGSHYVWQLVQYAQVDGTCGMSTWQKATRVRTGCSSVTVIRNMNCVHGLLSL